MFLHPSVIYGPVRSRRLGVSLGINLLPAGRKICSFECVYCECGWKQAGREEPFPDVNTVRTELSETLYRLTAEGQRLDYLTFSGNGEPTLHPEFETIMKITVALRNRYCPDTGIAVLSNAATLNNPSVRAGLAMAERRLFKLDAGSENMFRMINRPQNAITLEAITDSIANFKKDFTIQSMFLRGQYNGEWMDNTIDSEIALWLERLKTLRPKEVMMYSLDRLPAADGLRPVSREELQMIQNKVMDLGIPAEAY